MKLIKFKIAIRTDNGDTNLEIPGYSLTICGCKVVVHNWHYSFASGIRKDATCWTVSEYGTGRSMVSYVDTRKQAIIEATSLLSEVLEKKGRKHLLDTIKEYSLINS